MKKTNIKTEKRQRRHKKIRAKVIGTEAKPRLSIFKSNKYIYAQLIDDNKMQTLASFSSNKLKSEKITMTEKAKKTGKEIARIAKEKKIDTVVFDRGGFVYKGKIKAIADGAREGGLKF